MRTTIWSAAAVALVAVSGCGSSVTSAISSGDERPSLAGMWTASDGTGLKKFSEGGGCSGAYYDSGRPLDIGGPMYCQMSAKPDSSGRYLLDVTQGPNEATYSVEFDSADSATVSSNGTVLYTMTRR